MYFKSDKRIFDLLIAVPSFFMLMPLAIFFMILVWIMIGWPIFFASQRPGLHAKPFILYKFRTMTDILDGHGHPLPDANRMRPVGRFLRSLSLDELPELFNVIKGDMSLVGPRPLLIQYLDRYTPEQARRHEVKPGITGWAQVNGRNAISWDQKFALDVWYVDNRSMLLDMKIIALTIWKILKREGINQPGHATMEEFGRNHS